ncbi:hypothetical protein EI94DRAFT_1797987 [Lactarius quietus]|nr:hypothetical protein EI94DRAFT_1797987 [Lactarius quietus]
MQLENGNQTFLGPSVDDDGYVTDTYLIDDDEDEELSFKAPNKFLELLAIERPEWAASGSAKPANSASQESYLSINDADLCATTEHILNSAVSTAGPQDANLGWPVITKLSYKKPSTISERHYCLLDAANHLKPRATEILNQLENHQHYLMKITPLPCACICLIRSKVKERCNTITMALFLALGEEWNVIDYVSKQPLQYTYMFPRAAFANAPSNLMMHSWPYQNKHIITVIQDMYFTGGSASFAKKYNYLFMIFEGCEGEMIEVPVPMVVLVATVLYATIYEWRTGEQQVMEFLANMYLDVYNGHVNTLNHMRDKHPGAFHLLMADIHVRAS